MGEDNSTLIIILIVLAIVAILIFLRSRKNGANSNNGSNTDGAASGSANNSGSGNGSNFNQRKSKIPGFYTDESIFLKPDKPMKIYIASPFFNDEECEVLTTVENTLTERGYDIYSPRQHEDRDENAITPQWCEETFYKDRDALDMCDCMLMIYHGNYSDSGTAWECGYFGGKGKPVVVLQVGESSNLMIHISARANITLEDLKTYDFKTLPEKSYAGKAF